MIGRMGILVGFLGLMLLNSPQGFAEDPPEVSGIYKKNCAMCHKADGKGLAVMKTPDFTSKDWQSRHTDEQLIEAVTKGSGEGKIKMPAFGEGTKANLSPETIKALVTEVIRKFAE
jgi:cytochrome c5